MLTGAYVLGKDFLTLVVCCDHNDIDNKILLFLTLFEVIFIDKDIERTLYSSRKLAGTFFFSLYLVYIFLRKFVSSVDEVKRCPRL